MVWGLKRGSRSWGAGSAGERGMVFNGGTGGGGGWPARGDTVMPRVNMVMEIGLWRRTHVGCLYTLFKFLDQKIPTSFRLRMEEEDLLFQNLDL
jgi:hypothetical protein